MVHLRKTTLTTDSFVLWNSTNSNINFQRLYLKERVTQLVEETKNTETKLKIAEKTDKEARKRSKRSDTHNRAVTPLAKSKPSNTAAVLEKHKTNGVTTDHASLTEQSNAPKDRRPRVIVVSEGRSTGDSASLSSARTLSEDETELSQDEASSSDDCQMNAVAPWMPGEHWQSKIKEQLRVQKEVVKFADTALVPYHNPNSNPFAPGAAGQGNGSYPGGPWPSYSQPYPYQQHMQSYDPYYSYLPPPPPPETEPLPSAPKLSIRKKTEDPEVLKMREQLELLQLERKKAEEAQERAEMEQRIRQELETMRVAQEEARKEIELARAAAEAAAMARLEEVRKAEDERRRREAELKGQAAREERERMEAERQAEALRKYEQEALLQKAGMEARDLARETILLGYGTKAKDEEIKSLSSQLKDALSKASLSEARMWEERDSWMKERYALKEEALKARTDVMNEVRGTLSYGTWIALRPQGSGPTGPFARPPPPPGFSIPVPIRPTADRTSKPRAGSVSTVTVSSLATGSSVISLGRFWRLKYAFKRRMRKLLRMKVEEDD